ncbi:heparin lyase I family protein [Streptomyces sp. NPDC004685]
MQRRNVRPALRALRALRAKTGSLLLAPAAIASAMALITASPANAAVLWTADPASGAGAFDYTACDGGQITTTNWNDGHGDIFSINKPAGINRCEVAGAAGRTWSNNSTYWWGYSFDTLTDDAQTVFQWKSWGTGDQQQQNYPVLMKVEGGQLKIWYVAPGEVWQLAGSRAWSSGTWHKIELGITTRSDTTGSFALYVDGSLVVDQHNVRTWDDMGNNPRWGTYGSTITDVNSHVWLDDLKLGQTRADVD